MYIVIEPFKDKDGTIYAPGDVYANQDESRLKELRTKANKYKKHYIKEVKEVPTDELESIDLVKENKK